MSTPTKYPVVAALVSMDVTYEETRPVYVRPIVLTSGGFQVREIDGRPPRKYENNEDHPAGQFTLWTEEKTLAVIPVQALLVKVTNGWEFIQ